jgi:hypothetical protein
VRWCWSRLCDTPLPCAHSAVTVSPQQRRHYWIGLIVRLPRGRIRDLERRWAPRTADVLPQLMLRNILHRAAFDFTEHNAFDSSRYIGRPFFP